MTALALLTTLAFAQDRPAPKDIEINTASSPYGVGVGIVVGDPTGVSVIWRADDTNALQLGVGWSFLDTNLDLALDYQVTLARLSASEVKNAHFNVYVGGGVQLNLFDGRNNDQFLLGARVPVGIAFLPDGHPFDVFLQVTPILELVPATDFEIDAGIGARVFF